MGDDHLIKLDALAAISETALTRDTAIAIAETGLPTTFVPGRNLIFFCFAGAMAYRRGARHLVAGMCETDYSGYPDCRDDTIKAMQVALSLGLDKRVSIHTPLMWVDKADTFAMAEEIGGKAFLDLVIEESHSCYLGDRTGAMTGVMAAASARLASCALKVLRNFQVEGKRKRDG